jgi:DNA-nicking Smr family endonuclease
VGRRKADLLDKLFPPELGLDQDLDDAEAFREAMKGVQRITAATARVRAVRHRNRTESAETEEETDPRELLSRALEDPAELEFLLNEHVKGGARAWDSGLLKKLREGGFSVQAELDLHGFNQTEAVEQLEAFVQDCCRRGFSCVRVIHGKGKNSRTQFPALKNRVERWLSRRRSSRFVVAYTTARPVDGGGGALYVLLRCAQGFMPRG